MITRSHKIKIIPRVFTKMVTSLQFAKSKDSVNDINNIITEAEKYLSKNNSSVIITIVIPDSFYKSKKNINKIHQAHTFAISRDNKLLKLYDINYDLYYKSQEKCFDNYKLVINSLKKHRIIAFFPLTYAERNNFKSIMSNFGNEGSCFTYINELEELNAIN